MTGVHGAPEKITNRRSNVKLTHVVTRAINVIVNPDPGVIFNLTHVPNLIPTAEIHVLILI